MAELEPLYCLIGHDDEYLHGSTELEWILAQHEAHPGSVIIMKRREPASPAEIKERDRNFVPGDLVRISLPPSERSVSEHNGRHGVVIYGPDDDMVPGWLVTSAVGTLRCIGTELTMITTRENRSWPN